MDRRRHHLGVHQDFQDRLLGWAMDGDRKKHVWVDIYGFIYFFLLVFSYHTYT